MFEKMAGGDNLLLSLPYEEKDPVSFFAFFKLKSSCFYFVFFLPWDFTQDTQPLDAGHRRRAPYSNQASAVRWVSKPCSCKQPSIPGKQVEGHADPEIPVKQPPELVGGVVLNPQNYNGKDVQCGHGLPSTVAPTYPGLADIPSWAVFLIHKMGKCCLSVVRVAG